MTATAPLLDRVGDLLLQEGLVTREQLTAALTEQRTSGSRLGYLLVKQGAVSEIEVTRALARQLRMPAVDLSKFEPDAKILRLIPGEMARKHLVLPLRREGRTLTIAMADPSDLGLLQDLKFITRFDVFPVIAGEFTLRTLIDKHYEAGDQQQLADLLKDMEGIGDDLEVVVGPRHAHPFGEALHDPGSFAGHDKPDLGEGPRPLDPLRDVGGPLEPVVQDLQRADAADQEGADLTALVQRTGVHLEAPAGAHNSVRLDHPGAGARPPGSPVVDSDPAALACGLPKDCRERAAVGRVAVDAAQQCSGELIERAGQHEVVGLDSGQVACRAVQRPEQVGTEVLQPELGQR